MKPTKNRTRTVRITAGSVKKRGTSGTAFLAIAGIPSLERSFKSGGVPLNDHRLPNVCLQNVAGCLPLIPLCGRLPERTE